MDLALVAVVVTLAIVGALALGLMAVLVWRRARGPRPEEFGTLPESWRRDHIAGKAGGDR